MNVNEKNLSLHLLSVRFEESSDFSFWPDLAASQNTILSYARARQTKIDRMATVTPYFNCQYLFKTAPKPYIFIKKRIKRIVL